MNTLLHISAQGKLLLAGEYFVLDGATSLAIPTRLGQHFEIETTPSQSVTLHWRSYDLHQKIWFETKLIGQDFHPDFTTDASFSSRLRQILLASQELGAFFPQGAITVQSHLDFPRDWGLGSSSTLIYAVAKWLTINPFELLQKTFGGSGYDIACANSETAIFYLLNDGLPNWKPVLFNPPFREKIGFVYLGHKKNSREGIQAYRQKGNPPKALIQEISYLAKALTHQDTLEAFIKIIEKLEQRTGDWLDLTPVKYAQFDNFDGAIKSLGAWGGDFVLTVSPKGKAYMQDYFQAKGLHHYLTFEEMAL